MLEITGRFCHDKLRFFLIQSFDSSKESLSLFTIENSDLLAEVRNEYFAVFVRSVREWLLVKAVMLVDITHDKDTNRAAKNLA